MPTRGHLAKLVAKEGRRDELLAALRGMFEQVEKEPGTLLYLGHVSTEDPNVVWVYERFADDAAFAVHSDSAAHAEVTKLLHELCAAGTEAYQLDLVAGKGLPEAG